MSLAALKRRLTVGTVLELSHPDPRFGGRRTITTVQSNGIASLPEAWSEERKAESPRGSWLYWPAADKVTIDGDSFTVDFGHGAPLTYKIVEETK